MTKQIKCLYEVVLVYETSDSLKKNILSTPTKTQTQATKQKNDKAWTLILVILTEPLSRDILSTAKSF